MKEGIEIIANSKLLTKAFKHITDKSTSNNAPYHNLNHLLTVLKYANYLADEIGVNYNKKEELLLAALFHDVDHSEGKLKDNINIENAISQLYNFATRFNLSVEFVFNVALIIKATEYPYTIEDDNLNMLQEIIRDADMMQLFEPNWIQQNIIGLGKELGFTYQEFIPKQKQFMENLKFITTPAAQFAIIRLPDLIAQINFLESTLGPAQE